MAISKNCCLDCDNRECEIPNCRDSEAMRRAASWCPRINPEASLEVCLGNCQIFKPKPKVKESG